MSYQGDPKTLASEWLQWYRNTGGAVLTLVIEKYRSIPPDFGHLRMGDSLWDSGQDELRGTHEDQKALILRTFYS
jgi:hypothetical protein